MEERNIEIGKRIKKRREELGMTQEDLGNALWLNKSTIQRYETGKISSIKLPVIHAIANKLNVNPDWLILKTDDMGCFKPMFKEYIGAIETDLPSPDPNAELYAKYPNIKPIKRVKIPMLGNIACGEPTFADEEHETYIETDGHIQADFCLTCAGDSMEPKLMNGDIVFIRKQPEVNDGQIAAVLIEDEATLKRVYYDKQNSVLQLIAENPKYRPLVYSGEQLDHIRILGKAISLYRKIK